MFIFIIVFIFAFHSVDEFSWICVLLYLKTRAEVSTLDQHHNSASVNYLITRTGVDHVRKRLLLYLDRRRTFAAQLYRLFYGIII